MYFSSSIILRNDEKIVKGVTMVDMTFISRVSAIEITSIMSDLIVFLVFLPHRVICQNREASSYIVL